MSIKRRLLRSLRTISILYVMLIFLSYIVSKAMDFPNSYDVEYPKQGCYWIQGAFKKSIVCEGVWLDALAEFFLNFWLDVLNPLLFAYVLFLPELQSYDFSTNTLVYLLFGFLFTFIVSSPILYLLWYGIKGRHM